VYHSDSSVDGRASDLRQSWRDIASLRPTRSRGGPHPLWHQQGSGGPAAARAKPYKRARSTIRRASAYPADAPQPYGTFHRAGQFGGDKKLYARPTPRFSYPSPAAGRNESPCHVDNFARNARFRLCLLLRVVKPARVGNRRRSPSRGNAVVRVARTAHAPQPNWSSCRGGLRLGAVVPFEPHATDSIPRDGDDADYQRRAVADTPRVTPTESRIPSQSYDVTGRFILPARRRRIRERGWSFRRACCQPPN